MRENTDQKNFKYGHFPRSESLLNNCLKKLGDYNQKLFSTWHKNKRKYNQHFELPFLKINYTLAHQTNYLHIEKFTSQKQCLLVWSFLL